MSINNFFIVFISIISIFNYVYAYKPFVFTNITTGDISSYDLNAPGYNVPKNDASGAATIKGVTVIVDDTTTYVRMWYTNQSESDTGIDFQLPTVHHDLEAATQIDDQILISCSMTSPTDNSYNLLSLYDVDVINLTLTNEINWYMRDTIIQVLNDTLGQQDPVWFTRFQMYTEKSGNLNIEGLSVAHPDSGYDFVWGLRSPLFSPLFATFSNINGVNTQILDQGNAILVYAKNIFPTNGSLRVHGSPKFKVETIDLQGKGFRSLEYIPSLNGYLISAGPVPKADNYRLWLYTPYDTTSTSKYLRDYDVKLSDITEKLSQFSKLGRPEGILRRSDTKFTIISEEDPAFTVNPPYNYIDATVVLGLS